MGSIEERFEAKVVRSGAHHLWRGATDQGGVPQIRVKGRLTTARRVAWELAHGPLAADDRVLACRVATRCVRADHLRLAGSDADETVRDDRPERNAAGRARRVRGTGSLVEQSPGVWRVAASGAQGRRVRVVHGDQGDASSVLAVLVVEAAGVSLRMNDLVAGYLEHLRAAGYAASTVRRYEQLWRIWLAPDLGRRYVRETSHETMAATLNAMEDGGQSEASIRQASGLLTTAIGWAREHAPAKPTDTTRNGRRGPYHHGIDPNQARPQA